jgi:GT2 family glycosyltransferase
VSNSQTVAVVIPSWNSLALLPRCLESLATQETGVELLVVDNGSTDGSVAFLEEEGVSHLSLQRNIGFAAGVNLGVKQTSSTEILVLNADTVLAPGCIASLADALRGDPSSGGVQPRILQLEDDDGLDAGAGRIYSAGQALTKDGRAVEESAGKLQRPEHLVRREVFGVCGAACLLRRELFTELGGYDERYFAFYEDVDLNVRARIAGWRFGYVPEAVVRHVGNAAWSVGFRRPAAENARLVARNRLATQLKFMPASSAPRIALVEAGSLARSALQRRFRATLRGKLGVLPWLPALVRERRRLRRAGDPSRAHRWLGVQAG